MDTKKRTVGIAVAGVAGVGIGFGLGYLAFRRPPAKAAEPKAPELPQKDEQTAALPAAKTPAPPVASSSPPRQTQPPSQAPANQEATPQPVQGGGLQGLLNGLLGGGGNTGFGGGLGLNEFPSPPQQDYFPYGQAGGAGPGAPPAPAYTPQAPLGTAQNPVIIPRGFNI